MVNADVAVAVVAALLVVEAHGVDELVHDHAQHQAALAQGHLRGTAPCNLRCAYMYHTVTAQIVAPWHSIHR